MDRRVTLQNLPHLPEITAAGLRRSEAAEVLCRSSLLTQEQLRHRTQAPKPRFGTAAWTGATTLRAHPTPGAAH